MLQLASWDDYSSITDTKDRGRVQRLEQAINVVAGARRGEKMQVMKDVARSLGIPVKTLERNYYAFMKPKHGEPGGIAAIADDRKKVKLRESVKLAYEVFKAQFAEKNYESLESAHRHFIREFNNYKLVAFGLNPREAWKQDHPNRAVPDYLGVYIPYGWSYQNFMAKWKKDPTRLARLAWTREGQWAAAKFVHDVIRSRYDEANDKQLPGGAVYEWDDGWEDVMVIDKGASEVQRPMAFHCYDVGTGFHFDPWFKPRNSEQDSDGERVKRNNLTEQMFRMTFMAQMINVGIYRGGCLNIQEHATTAIRENVQRQIAEIPQFGRLIRFSTSGIMDKAAHRGMYQVLRGGGNPRYKSIVEGGHRVMHIEMANLPGNMGRSAEHRHSSWAAIEKYTNDMLAECDKLVLSERVRNLLRLPVMRFGDFVMAYGEMTDRLMDSTDHRLEGWVKYYKEEFRVPGDNEERWIPMEEFDKLPPGLQHLIVQSGLIRSRKMSRREAWATWQHDLIKVPACEAIMFFDWEKDAKILKVTRQRTIEFEDRTYYPNGKIVFDAVVQDRGGNLQELCPGDEVRVFINPMINNGNTIWIQDKDKKYLGMAQRTKYSAFWGDEGSIKRAAAYKLADQAHLLAETRAMHKDDESQLILDHAHNQLIIEAAKAAERVGVTPRRRRVTAESEEREQAEAGAFLEQLSTI